MFHPRKIKTQHNAHVNAEGLNLRIPNPSLTLVSAQANSSLSPSLIIAQPHLSSCEWTVRVVTYIGQGSRLGLGDIQARPELGLRLGQGYIICQARITPGPGHRLGLLTLGLGQNCGLGLVSQGQSMALQSPMNHTSSKSYTQVILHVYSNRPGL